MAEEIRIMVDVGEEKGTIDREEKEMINNVFEFDDKTVSYFQLEEKEYNYHEITRKIDEQMTEEMLADICGECSWFPVSACKKNICGCH